VEPGGGRPPSLRLFVAIPLSDEVRAVMRRRTSRLRSQLPGCRWVDPEAAHLTLVFLGQVAAASLDPLAAACEEVFSLHPPLPLRLHAGGTFPPARPARVLWVGVRGPGELAVLQKELAERCAAVLGVEPEGRPFHAHVTLARCNPPLKRQVVERFVQEAQGSWGEELLATHGVLFESRLSPRGAQHLERARFPLLGGAA
jgi:2'-5' RNA ligase